MIIVDASIAIRILAAEPLAQAAVKRLLTEPERCAPDWIRMEVVNGLSKKVREENLPRPVAHQALELLSAWVPSEVSGAAYLEDALVLSLAIDHSVYDCLYLSVALDLGGKLVTGDKRFVKAAERGGYAAHVELLA